MIDLTPFVFYNMVDLDGLDLAEVDGSIVPGIYQKIYSNLDETNREIFYHWFFAGIVLPPATVTIDNTTSGQLTVNDQIVVKSNDSVYIIGHIYVPVIEPISITENGNYQTPVGVDGYDPITVNVPDIPPVLDQLSVTENGTYTPPSGTDGYDEVIVNVPDIPPVLDQLSVTENGTYTPPSGTDGYDEVIVNVPDIPPVLDQLSVTENGTYTPPSGTDGYDEVVVNVPSFSPLIQPLHTDCHNGYIGQGNLNYDPSTNSYYDVFEVEAGKHYIPFITAPVGNRFRVAFFTTDPSLATANLLGTQVGSDLTDPSTYTAILRSNSGLIFSPTNNGFIAIGKTSQHISGLVSYLLCIENIN